MNTIIAFGRIIGISILVSTLPLLDAIRMSAEERESEFGKLEEIRKIVTDLHFPLDGNEARPILSEYILSIEEMEPFTEYLHNTGNPPEWSIARKLKNYENYKFLKYDAHLQSLPFSVSSANEIIMELESNVFENSPRIPNDIAYDIYMEKNLYELLTFEDYYAIMVYLQDESQINFENLAALRMKRALYSLAIRQYNPNFIPSYILNLEPCFFKEKRTERFAYSIHVGYKFEKSTFSICNSKFKESYSYSSEYKIDKSFFWMHYGAIITDPAVVVSLEEILDNYNGHLYVLLPEVKLQVMDYSKYWINKYGKIVNVKVITENIVDRSSWLTAVANQIEEYKEIERAHFVNED
ncbi:uncharacterized protein LOC122505051 [Leptopilina heterotoma]|uniref:uncharacterized protein LOC122505051 n=1 Tax=Leptopilina heterotoma TaxID=63436 RepID=UPI001CA80C6C|nr:uncharacterized protein LOC122505051 [Leptopilina heterotoma]